MIYSLCGAPFILCYFFISAHVMKSYTYFQRMAIPLPPSHLSPVSCLAPSIFILHIYTLFCLYSVHLPVGSLNITQSSVCKQDPSRAALVIVKVIPWVCKCWKSWVRSRTSMFRRGFVPLRKVLVVPWACNSFMYRGQQRLMTGIS